VVHQIRNSCKYVVYKDKKEFTADMKNIYNAPNKEVAAAELDNLERNGEESILMPYFHGGTNGMT
jgi:Transposase, Mutator family.